MLLARQEFCKLDSPPMALLQISTYYSFLIKLRPCIITSAFPGSEKYWSLNCKISIPEYES